MGQVCAICRGIVRCERYERHRGRLCGASARLCVVTVVTKGHMPASAILRLALGRKDLLEQLIVDQYRNKLLTMISHLPPNQDDGE